MGLYKVKCFIKRIFHKKINVEYYNLGNGKKLYFDEKYFYRNQDVYIFNDMLVNIFIRWMKEKNAYKQWRCFVTRYDNERFGISFFYHNNYLLFGIPMHYDDKNKKFWQDLENQWNNFIGRLTILERTRLKRKLL